MTDLRPFSPSFRPNFPALRADLIAGLTVAAISLPQSMAYALAAGVDPRFGLYTAIVFAAVAGLFGSSRALVNGPTGAAALAVFSALAFIDPEARLESYEAMFMLAAMIGAVQIVIAAFRLGDWMRFISDSVVTGFITGAALLTIAGQLANALGVKAQGAAHEPVLARLWLTLTQDAAVNPRALALSLGAILLAVAGRAFVKRFRLPQIDMLFSLLAVSLAAFLLGWSRAEENAKPLVALIDAIPASLPALHVPEVRLSWLGELAPSALTLGLLGSLEALTIARAIARQSGETLDCNRQILAEGLGNLAGAFFRCMPGSGSLSRTAINVQAGAVTRVSGLVCAGAVALAAAGLGSWAAAIPKPALAGLLIVAAARLIDVARIRATLSSSRYDAFLAFVTAAAALALGVEIAIFVGATLSAALYLPRAAQLKIQELVVSRERVLRARIPSDPPPRAVAIHDLEGELFFAAAPVLTQYLDQAAAAARAQGVGYLVLRLKRVRNPDAVALEALDRFLADARAHGPTVLLAGLRPDIHAALEGFGIIGRHSPDLVFPEEAQDSSATIKAVRRAYALATRDALGASEGADRQPRYYLV